MFVSTTYASQLTSLFVSPYSLKQKFVSFVRKFTQALHLSYEQFSSSFDDNDGLLSNIVGGNKALGEENVFRYRLDSLQLSALTS